MTGALLRNRIRVAGHYFASLGVSERIRLLLILGILLFISSYWVTDLTMRPLALENETELPATLRIEAYRVGALIAAIVGFSSFSSLWRSQDVEVLNRLPVLPTSILRYRLTMTLVGSLPALFIAMVGFLPLLWRGHPARGLEALFYLVVLYCGTAISGMAWHMFAGYSVVTAGYSRLKHLLAGTMVLPDRTLLLYSPLLAAASGFGIGLIFLVGESRIAAGNLASGAFCLAISAGTICLAYIAAERTFVRFYYQALAALADGELLGEVTESSPAAEYMGAWYVQRIPMKLRPLVARDLKQAWRRNRLDHYALLTSASALVALTLSARSLPFVRAWLWPGLELLLIASASLAFRMTSSATDPPWLWLSLPARLRDQYFARWLAVQFFPSMLLPILLVALKFSGEAWLSAIPILLVLSFGASTTALNLALALFTRQRLGGTVYLALSGLAVVVAKGEPLFVGLLLLFAGFATLLPLRHLATDLADAEQVR